MSLLRLPLRATPVTRMPQTITHDRFARAVSLFRQRSSLPHLRLMSQQQNGSSKQRSPVGEKQSEPAPSWPQVKILDDLGATRGVKIFILVCLSIYGTLETVFYAKAAIRYFYPPKEDGEL